MIKKLLIMVFGLFMATSFACIIYGEALPLQGRIIYSEDFIDNRNNWEQFKDSEIVSKVANGVYVFEVKVDSIFEAVTNSVPIDQDKDFKIETCIMKTKGKDNNLYGLVWGYKNNKNFFSFGISGNGSYTYLRRVDGKWEEIIDWTNSSYIRRGNASNKLTVVKSGNKIQFLINGNQVDEAPFEKFFGNNIGITVNTQLVAEFDNLIVTQYSNDEESGNILFQDDFIDNNNRWYEMKDKNVLMKVENGKYIFEHKQKNSGYYTWYDMNLNQEMDFKIETVVIKTDGVDNYAFGLTWGLKDVNNYFGFGISGGGSYQVEKTIDNHWEQIIDWNSSSYINKGNFANKLGVLKKGDKLEFYINDRKVDEMPFEKFFGNKVGFYVNNKINLAFDSIVVIQYNHAKGIPKL